VALLPTESAPDPPSTLVERVGPSTVDARGSGSGLGVCNCGFVLLGIGVSLFLFLHDLGDRVQEDVFTALLEVLVNDWVVGHLILRYNDENRPLNDEAKTGHGIGQRPICIQFMIKFLCRLQAQCFHQHSIRAREQHVPVLLRMQPHSVTFFQHFFLFRHFSSWGTLRMLLHFVARIRQIILRKQFGAPQHLRHCHRLGHPLSIQHKIFLHAFEHHFGQPVDLMMSMVIAVVLVFKEIPMSLGVGVHKVRCVPLPMLHHEREQLEVDALPARGRLQLAIVIQPLFVR